MCLFLNMVKLNNDEIEINMNPSFIELIITNFKNSLKKIYKEMLQIFSKEELELFMNSITNFFILKNVPKIINTKFQRLKI